MKKIFVFISLTASLALITPNISYADCGRFSWSEGAYCGPGKAARVIPDEFFGPFSNACRTHDWCYHAAGEQIAKEIQEGYLRSKSEADNRRDNSRRQCDSYFSQELSNTCSQMPDSKRNGCYIASRGYAKAVKVAGIIALDISIRKALACR